MSFEILYAASAAQHLRRLTAAERRRALDAIEKQLSNQPLVETRNRKPLRPNPLAPWELRLGSLRVFYDVTTGDPGVVHVLAVGKKDRGVLRIGGEVIEL